MDEKFSKFFRSMGCAGEVSLLEDKDNVRHYIIRYGSTVGIMEVWTFLPMNSHPKTMQPHFPIYNSLTVLARHKTKPVNVFKATPKTLLQVSMKFYLTEFSTDCLTD